MRHALVAVDRAVPASAGSATGGVCRNCALANCWEGHGETTDHRALQRQAGTVQHKKKVMCCHQRHQRGRHRVLATQRGEKGGSPPSRHSGAAELSARTGVAAAFSAVGAPSLRTSVTSSNAHDAHANVQKSMKEASLSAPLSVATTHAPHHSTMVGLSTMYAGGVSLAGSRSTTRPTIHAGKPSSRSSSAQ